MDKYEYKVSLNEINSLVEERRFQEAAQIADTIEWRRVKSPETLCRISDIYKVNKEFEKARDICALANNRKPDTPQIIFSLCELNLYLYGKQGQQSALMSSLQLMQQYQILKPNDPKRLILQYKMYKVSPVSMQEKIGVLEQLKSEQPTARWEYELAKLYLQAGENDKAEEECRNIRRNYGGKYADAALDLLDQIGTGSENAEAGEEAVESKPQRDYAVKSAEEQAAGDRLEDNVARGMKDLETIASEPVRTRRREAPKHNVAEEPAEEQVRMSDDSMSIGQVMDEWDRIRKDIRARNDEQRAQKLLEGTGPLLQNFDETARHGLIENIEKESRRQRRQIRSGAGNILTAEQQRASYGRPARRDAYEEDRYAYDRRDRYDEQYQDDDRYAQDRYDDRYAEDRYDDRYAEEAPYAEERQYAEEEAPYADERQYAEENYNEEQDSYETEETVEEEPQEEPEEAVESVETEEVAEAAEETSEEETLRTEEPEEYVRRGTAFAAAVADEAASEDADDEEEDHATRRWNSAEIRKAMEAQRRKMQDAQAVVDGQEAAEHSRHEIEEAARQEAEAKIRQEAKARAEAEAAERLRIEEEERAKLEAEARERREAEELLRREAREKAQREAAQKRAREEAEEAARREREEQIRREAQEKARAEYEQQAMLEEEQAKEADETVEEEVQEDLPVNTTELDVEAVQDVDAQEPSVEETEEAVSEEVPMETAEMTETEELRQVAEAIADTDTPEPETKSDAAAAIAAGASLIGEKAPSQEEIKLFGPFYRMKENRDQVAAALDKISLASYTGNVVITGNAVTARRVAQGLLEMIRQSDSNFTGKIAKASGQALNKLSEEKFAETLSKIENGALIIERAAALSEETTNNLYQQLEHKERGVIVIMMDAKKPLEDYLAQYHSKLESFNAQIDIKPLNDKALVEYGKDYANSQGFALDEFGELALTSRISGMQSPTHRVALKEVRDLVDEAISYASRKTPHTLVEVLTHKRSDAEGRILLHEKDFSHY